MQPSRVSPLLIVGTSTNDCEPFGIARAIVHATKKEVVLPAGRIL